MEGAPAISYGLKRLDHAVGNVPVLADAAKYIMGFTGEGTCSAARLCAEHGGGGGGGTRWPHGRRERANPPGARTRGAGFHEFAEFVAEDVGTVDSGLNSVVLANNNE